MSKDSPFIYGTTVSGYSFTNRELETSKLESNLLNGINTTIISPRRWGKSSLVEKVIKNINEKDKQIKTVIIDLFSISSEEEFLERFAKEIIKASSTKLEDWMLSGKEFFSKLIPKFSVGLEPNLDFDLSFDYREIKKNSEEILNLPEIIAQKKGIKFIICLDEFQNLTSFEDYENFEKKLRAYWQRHKLVTFCLYGSKRHMMANIFNSPSKPFYRFGDIMLLKRIETPKWVSFIKEGFVKTDKYIDNTLAEIIPFKMKNHSWYVQQFAHYLWNLTDKTVSMEGVQLALNELVNANSPLYQKEIETISQTQLNLLKAVAKNESKFTSISIMQKFSLGTPNNVVKNKSILVKNDIIQTVDDVFEFVDPVFELWFKNQYFKQPYL